MKLFKKIITIVVIFLLISISGLAIWNLDVLIRFYHVLQNVT